MVQKTSNELEVGNKPAYMYYLMTKSGQCSPTSDTLDSGTGSDLESTSTTNGNSTSASPTLTNAVAKSIRKFSDLSLQNPQTHRLKSRSSNESYHTDSEESESSLSCDSLNSNEMVRLKNNGTSISPFPMPRSPITSISLAPPAIASNRTVFTSDENNVTKISFLPHSLLRDIRDRSTTMTKSHATTAELLDRATHANNNTNIIISSDTSANLKKLSFKRLNQSSDYSNVASAHAIESNRKVSLANGRVSVKTFGDENKIYEDDKYYQFHMNERIVDVPKEETEEAPTNKDDDTFAGYKDIGTTVAASTIRSSKGTVRGVKNRVRNGIATFLQMQQTNVKASDFFLFY